MDEEYEFVRMSESNFDDFALLAKDAHGVDPTHEEIRALFDTGPWGTDHIAYLAYHRETGDTAAFYGIFPCSVEYNGREYLAAQSGSTMTHSKHRKKGLFYKTGLKTFDLARREGIEFVFGFPNPFSYPGLMKLGWTHDDNIGSYHLFVPTFPLGFLAHKAKFLLPLYRAWFRFVTHRWRVKSFPFPNSSTCPDIGVVKRDARTFGYKPESDDRFMIRVGESTVWLNQQQGRVGIGDLLLAGGDLDFKKVLRALKFICFLSGSVHLRSYASPGSKLDSLFRTNGYSPRVGIQICHLNLGSELPLENFKYVYADFDTF